MGYFFREIDFDQDSNYTEFCNLKIDFLYRWDKTNWSGTSNDLLIYITINNRKELWVGQAETEYEQAKMRLVGTYREKNILATPKDFKEQMKKYFLLNSEEREKYNAPSITTLEIC